MRILIDTDPGIDDAMAIFYALASPELDVVGLTTVFGNVPTTLATHNALALLEIAGRSDIAVAAGPDRPLAMDYVGPATWVHGEHGQGDVHLPDPHGFPVDADAATFIVETVMAAPGEITLVPLGPLTNIALALRAEPQLAANVAGIVLMGGNAFVGGNKTPGAEANIYHDPEAADVVFAADCPLAMAGLDVTEQTLMTNADLAGYGTMDNAMARHIAAITPYYARFYKDRLGIDGIHVHDSTCISYLLAPHHYRWVEHPIAVDTGQSVCRGKTLPALHVSDRETAWQGRRNVRILTEVDARAVIELEHSRIAAA